MILPLVLRKALVLNRILRAIMIAGHTLRAVSLPLRSPIDHPDIVQWAMLRAYSAACARLEHPIAFVGHEKIESIPDEPRFEPRHRPYDGILNPRSAAYALDYPWQFFLRRVNLSLRTFFRIEVEAREAQIGFRHLEAIAGIESQARLRQRLPESLQCQSHLVPAGAGEPDL